MDSGGAGNGMTVGETRLGPDGVWCKVHRLPPYARAAALFLDRDGVLVEEVGHLHRPQDVRLLPGAAQLVAAANRAEVPVVVVTNQAGIGRGLYGWADFASVQDRLDELLGRQLARVDAVLACPFHHHGQPPWRYPDHPARKPNSGMLVRAAEALDLELAQSWLVGDALSDVLAARAAGLAGAVHVLTGHGARERAGVSRISDLRVRVVDDAHQALAALPLLAGTDP